MKLGASGHWLGTRTGAGGTTTLFWPQPIAPWTTGCLELALRQAALDKGGGFSASISHRCPLCFLRKLRSVNPDLVIRQQLVDDRVDVTLDCLHDLTTVS